MTNPQILAEVWRGDFLESVHHGYAVICGPDGEVIEAWGNPDKMIFPRSSAKPIQALPLIESGAAAAFGLTSKQLALSCASHEGAPTHTAPVSAWLAQLGLGEPDLLCGAQMPADHEDRNALIRAHQAPCQLHNNCSGKHAGFLTLKTHLGASADYVDPEHPVQKAARAAQEDITGDTSPTFGIDGCSAPNFASTMHGLARAGAFFANAHKHSGKRADAAAALTQAMMAHPELVAGKGRACTELMQAAKGHAAIKTGAEGVFLGILPQLGFGIAVKAADGATRASECIIAALLVRLGVLPASHPAILKRMDTEMTNRRGLVVGSIRPAETLRQKA